MPQDSLGDTEAICENSLTVFLGGAGMSGGYNQEMVNTLREAGICRPTYGNYAGLWGVADGAGILDMLADAVSVPFVNQPDFQPPGRDTTSGDFNDQIRMGLEDIIGLTDTRDRLDWRARSQDRYNYTLPGVGVPQPVPEQRYTFNMIGYSWGAAVAARVALFYASSGVEVDFLGLVGAPINATLLSQVRGNSLIKRVGVVDLTDEGDTIYAGMSDGALIVRVPVIAYQMFTPGQEPRGHFHYSGSGTAESRNRKRQLVAELMGMGLE